MKKYRKALVVNYWRLKDSQYFNHIFWFNSSVVFMIILLKYEVI